jgi:hypothetical protein
MNSIEIKPISELVRSQMALEISRGNLTRQGKQPSNDRRVTFA